MVVRVVKLIGFAVLALLAVGIAMFVGMRSKYPPMLDAVRRFNRSVSNPNAMKTAGQPGAYAGIIRHVGRNSGADYETPIGPYPTDDGFIIALPYGTRPDWLKNVLAAGSAVIVTEGETYDVDTPQVISGEEALPSIPSKEQRSLRLFNVNDYLRVATSGPQATEV
jgi:deazaflavin-dependent oxidoreductase (nitroreductase family)